ncbi:hypothetical protein L1987_85803 [Smallanthus sonchifolius]|uniref:Uncharacterized protein n=1 Tax=Smallanthus sonchifolius TaxID=185202 RepID=A0ACB8XX10_9ASTR|nr:hypothetical protein L1987_85803 [Smallanthus sonchifolius]
MASPTHPIYISDDDDVHEVIVIPDPEIFNVSDDEAEVEPDVLEASDESEPESDYEENPEEMTDVEHEAPEPEDDPEVVVDEEPEAPMEAEPEMEARVPVMRRPSFRPYRLRPGGALFMFTPRKQILPPRKRKLAPAFGEEDTVPPPPSPKRARAADIIEDDDTSDEEPPSTFEVGGTSQPPLPVTADMEPEDVDPPTLAVRCEMYDHQLESLRGVVHAIQEAQYLDDQARHILHDQAVEALVAQRVNAAMAQYEANRNVTGGTNSGAGGGGTSGNMNGSGNENGGGSGGGNGNGTGNTSGAGGSGTRGEDTNGNQLTLASSLERSLLMIIMF